MAENLFRRLIKSKDLTVGIMVNVREPAVIEMAAYAGFGFTLIRMGRRTEDLIRASEAAKLPLLIALPGPNPDPVLIGEALDMGMDGINISLISTREEAQNLVKYCKLSPLGDREVFPGGRLGQYWGLPMDEFANRANDAMVTIRIETKEAIGRAEEILSVPGIDMVSVGVSDLCRSLGVRRDHPMIADMQQHVIDVACSFEVTVLQVVMTPEEMGEWVNRSNKLHLFMMATDGTQIGRAFRGIIQRCDELASESGRGHVKGTLSRVDTPMLPWLTQKKPIE